MRCFGNALKVIFAAGFGITIIWALVLTAESLIAMLGLLAELRA
jgi:hypothetical protein